MQLAITHNRDLCLGSRVILEYKTLQLLPLNLECTCVSPASLLPVNSAALSLLATTGHKSSYIATIITIYMLKFITLHKEIWKILFSTLLREII